jgi:hypothetical protein
MKLITISIILLVLPAKSFNHLFAQEKKWLEVDKQADELLNLMKPDQPDAKDETPQEQDAREHVLHELGGPFFVSRDKVQAELKLSDTQKQKLWEKLSVDVQETQKMVEKLKDLKAEERDKEMKLHRQKSGEKLEVFLKDVLTVEQMKRFQQLKLQYDTPATMLQPEIVKELKITDAQLQQFRGAILEMQKEVEPLIKMARSRGNPKEILPKVIKLRLNCQGKIESLLNDEQKKRWQEMVGKPFVIW